jgi:hypothetical protein
VLSPFILSISIIYRTFLKGSTSFKIFCSYVVSLCLFSKLSSFLHDCHSTNWRQLFTNWDALFELLFFWCRFVRKGDAVVVCCEGLIEAHILSSLWLNKQVKRHPSGQVWVVRYSHPLNKVRGSISSCVWRISFGEHFTLLWTDPVRAWISLNQCPGYRVVYTKKKKKQVKRH